MDHPKSSINLLSPDNLRVQNRNGLFPEVFNVDKVVMGGYLDCFKDGLSGFCPLLLSFYGGGFNFLKTFFVLNFCSSSYTAHISTMSEGEKEHIFLILQNVSVSSQVSLSCCGKAVLSQVVKFSILDPIFCFSTVL